MCYTRRVVFKTRKDVKMNNIIKISELNNLTPNTLAIIDDENNGVCLGLKSDKKYNHVDFKYKEIKYKNNLFGSVLLKLDDSFYSCHTALKEDTNKNTLEKLLCSNSFNLIVFGTHQENDVYRINNDFKNKLLFNIIDSQDINGTINTDTFINEINRLYPAEVLWNS